MNIVKNIISSGIPVGKTYPVKRGLLISNYICFILIVCITFLFTIRNTFYNYIDIDAKLCIYYYSVGVLAFMTPILLNRFGLIHISRIILCYIPVLFTWYLFISQMLGLNQIQTNIFDSIRIYILVFSVIPYLVFERKNWEFLLIGVLPYFISILFFENILSFYEVGYQQKGIPETGYELMQLRSITAYLILNSASYAFQSIINSNDQYNGTLIQRLKNINQELISSKRQLTELNNKLELKVQERTEEIVVSNQHLKAKNKQLADFAFFNSHKLRAPVANILGLINLLEQGSITRSDRDLIIDKVKQSSNVLENVVSEINLLLEKNTST
ncbi:MAG: hypothetical protein ABJH05_05160 [Fulvivirga sp.]